MRAAAKKDFRESERDGAVQVKKDREYKESERCRKEK